MSVCLSYKVFSLLLAKYYDSVTNVFYGSLIASGFFGIWPIGHIAVQWDAAIFDLLGTFLVLVSGYYYIRYRLSNKKIKYTYAFLFLFFYYLSVRTKEMFIVFPLVVFVFEIGGVLQNKKKIKLDIVRMISYAGMLVFLTFILYRKKQGSGINNPDNPYFQVFSPIKMFINLMKYSQMLFDIENFGLFYEKSYIGLVVSIILAIGVIWGFFRCLKADYKVVVAFLAICISISTVLPMVNMQHDLYLYFPSLFFGLMIAFIFNYGHQTSVKYLCYFLLIAFLAANYSSGYETEKKNWIANCKMENDALYQLQKYSKPIEGTSVYILLDSVDSYSPFYYGDGNIVRVAYEDSSLNTYLVTDFSDVELKKPYWILTYKDGEINSLEKDVNRELSVDSYYLYKNDDGSITIAIVPNVITQGISIYIDDYIVNTTIGETFISAIVPAEMLKERKIKVYIKDEFGTLSKNIVIEL